jgi:hypothetical protein
VLLASPIGTLTRSSQSPCRPWNIGITVTLLELNTGVGMRKMLFAGCCSMARQGQTSGKAVQTPAFGPAPGHGHVGFAGASPGRSRRRSLHRRTPDGTTPMKAAHSMPGRCDWRDCEIRGGSIADGQPYHQGDRRKVMFRLATIISSEVSSIAFTVYLWFSLFQSPGHMPPPDAVMRDSFSFCGICAGYWWFQSANLALSGAGSSIRVATDVLSSFIPLIVASYALIDFWRGLLPRSDFKQYSAYFAVCITLLDVTFNAIIMARLSRRYIGEVPRQT